MSLTIIEALQKASSDIRGNIQIVDNTNILMEQEELREFGEYIQRELGEYEIRAIIEQVEGVVSVKLENEGIMEGDLTFSLGWIIKLQGDNWIERAQASISRLKNILEELQNLQTQIQSEPFKDLAGKWLIAINNEYTTIEGVESAASGAIIIGNFEYYIGYYLPERKMFEVKSGVGDRIYLHLYPIKDTHYALWSNAKEKGVYRTYIGQWEIILRPLLLSWIKGKEIVEVGEWLDDYETITRIGRSPFILDIVKHNQSQVLAITGYGNYKIKGFNALTIPTLEQFYDICMGLKQCFEAIRKGLDVCYDVLWVEVTPRQIIFYIYDQPRLFYYPDIPYDFPPGTDELVEEIARILDEKLDAYEWKKLAQKIAQYKDKGIVADEELVRMLKPFARGRETVASTEEGAIMILILPDIMDADERTLEDIAGGQSFLCLLYNNNKCAIYQLRDWEEVERIYAILLDFPALSPQDIEYDIATRTLNIKKWGDRHIEGLEIKPDTDLEELSAITNFIGEFALDASFRGETASQDIWSMKNRIFREWLLQFKITPQYVIFAPHIKGGLKIPKSDIEKLFKIDTSINQKDVKKFLRQWAETFWDDIYPKFAEEKKQELLKYKDGQEIKDKDLCMILWWEKEGSKYAETNLLWLRVNGRPFLIAFPSPQNAICYDGDNPRWGDWGEAIEEQKYMYYQVEYNHDINDLELKLARESRVDIRGVTASNLPTVMQARHCLDAARIFEASYEQFRKKIINALPPHICDVWKNYEEIMQVDAQKIQFMIDDIYSFTMPLPPKIRKKEWDEQLRKKLEKMKKDLYALIWGEIMKEIIRQIASSERRQQPLHYNPTIRWLLEPLLEEGQAYVLTVPPEYQEYTQSNAYILERRGEDITITPL